MNIKETKWVELATLEVGAKFNQGHTGIGPKKTGVVVAQHPVLYRVTVVTFDGVVFMNKCNDIKVCPE